MADRTKEFLESSRVDVQGSIPFADQFRRSVLSSPAQQGVSTGSGAAITTVYKPGQNVPL